MKRPRSVIDPVVPKTRRRRIARWQGQVGEDGVRTFMAKYGGTCGRCGLRINPGQTIQWDPATPRLRFHQFCPDRVPAPVDLDHRRTWRRHRPWNWEANRRD